MNDLNDMSNASRSTLIEFRDNPTAAYLTKFQAAELGTACGEALRENCALRAQLAAAKAELAAVKAALAATKVQPASPTRAHGKREILTEVPRSPR